MMNDIHIDRLVLQVPGLAEDEGRQLALQVAAGLAAAGGLPEAGDIPALQLEVVADPRAGLPHLADRIVADMLRQLRHTP
jgi:hypothetical protein